MQSKEQVTIVYIDFTKTFDLVSHQKLFAKLHSYGVRGNVLLWLQNFFLLSYTTDKNRLQSV